MPINWAGYYSVTYAWHTAPWWHISQVMDVAHVTAGQADGHDKTHDGQRIIYD